MIQYKHFLIRGEGWSVSTLREGALLRFVGCKWEWFIETGTATGCVLALKETEKVVTEIFSNLLNF